MGTGWVSVWARYAAANDADSQVVKARGSSAYPRPQSANTSGAGALIVGSCDDRLVMTDEDRIAI